MADLLPFFIVLITALFFSQLFKRFHLPWVVVLILTGIVIGPNGFDVLETNSTLEFFADIGIVLLMFMAGLETKIESIAKYKDCVLNLTVFNSIIPFITGFGLGFLFDYGLVASFLLGAVFMSSAIAVIVPSLERNKIIETKLGKTILSATMIQDVISLTCLSIVLRGGNGISLNLPLPLTLVLLIAVVFALRWATPRVEAFFTKDVKQDDTFEQEPRVIFTILIGTVIMFELIGLHPIIAGFFSGLVLAHTIKGKILRAKLHAISYGLFIPLFFVMVGVQTNITSLFESAGAVITSSVIIVSAVVSKFFSGFAAGKMDGFSPLESTIVGFATMPRLSTSLAIAVASYSADLFDESLVTMMIALTIVTTFVGPLALDILGSRWEEYHKTRGKM
jgi:Kef-type K+ transport system membrane component KefB